MTPTIITHSIRLIPGAHEVIAVIEHGNLELIATLHVQDCDPGQWWELTALRVVDVESEESLPALCSSMSVGAIERLCEAKLGWLIREVAA